MTTSEKKAYVVVDLGYGDGGKGTITDFLTRDQRAHTVIRFNGGGQAGHNVVTPDGRHHTFSHFGSGTFVPGVQTFLSRYMLVSPGALLVEAKVLAKNGVTDALERMVLSDELLMVTPFHRAANRIRELARRDARHGSVGMGIWETENDAREHPELTIRAKHLKDPHRLEQQLRRVQKAKRLELDELIRANQDQSRVGEYASILEGEIFLDHARRIFLELADSVRIVREEYLAKRLALPGSVIFEGAQGVLLDEWHGFHPYTTGSTCTFENALTLLSGCDYDGEVTKLGVVRSYAVRHGVGPFVTEDVLLGCQLNEAHNTKHEWQQSFRHGWFDAVAIRYAIEVCGGVDALAVTCLDQIGGLPRACICEAYDAYSKAESDRLTRLPVGKKGDLAFQEALTKALERSIPRYRAMTHPVDDIVQALNVPVCLTSDGPTATSKRWV